MNTHIIDVLSDEYTDYDTLEDEYLYIQEKNEVENIINITLNN